MGPGPYEANATDIAAALARGDISARQAVQSSLDRIAALDERLQAFITVSADAALAEADRQDSELRDGRLSGPLHGMPVAVKDNIRTAGIRTTWGSILRRDFVPEQDDEVVRRLRAAGAIIVGKTNTPEFAFGAVCTNMLRGATANPWNMDLTSGGSSGGSAVAVTAGMTPLALGTDFGGSVRTPASFCGCVGLRPTPGRIADPDRPLGWNRLSTAGILSRTVDDAALMLSAISGRHDMDPTSFAEGRPEPENMSARDLRVAASATLNHAFRIDSDVREAFESAVHALSAVFPKVTHAAPDMTGASDAFKTLRAAGAWRSFGELVERSADGLTESFVWNVRSGRAISAEEYLKAEEARTRAYRSVARFFRDHDILVLPSASVLPFNNEHGDVLEIDGQPCETIIDYLACTYLVSLIGFPAISIPAIWTSDGRPFGIQLVARPYEEGLLLAAARRLEEAGFRYRIPPVLQACPAVP